MSTCFAIAALALSIALPGPEASSSAAGLQAVLAQYAMRVRAMDHAGIASLFADDGEIVNAGERPIEGPAAIDAYLRRFAGYKVLRYEIVATKTTINGPAAVQTGSFHQRVRLPDGRVTDVFGKFKAEWMLTPNGWRIWRMGTVVPE